MTAHCPKGTQIFSGGFQRTNFTTPGVKRFGGHIYGGDYITESRADGTDGWRVSGGATGENGGELTAIAYCGEDSSLPIKEVSTEVSVGEKKAASATTPSCPDDYALISGGFSFNGSHDALFADGYFTRGGRWAATGYGWFGSANLTAYGYCAQARDTLDRSDFPSGAATGTAALRRRQQDGALCRHRTGRGLPCCSSSAGVRWCGAEGDGDRGWLASSLGQWRVPGRC